MRPTNWLGIALLIVGLLTPLVLATGTLPGPSPPPIDAHHFSVGTRDAAWWFGPSPSKVNQSTNASTPETLWFAVLVDKLGTNDTSYTIYANVSSATLTFKDPNAVFSNGYGPSDGTQQYPRFAQFTFMTPANPGSAAFNYTVDMSVWNGTNLSSSAHAAGFGEIIIESTVAPSPPPGLPTSYLVGGGIVLLVAVALGAYGLRQRNVRRRMRGKTRSTTLQQLEQEEKAKKPEQQAQVQQEIRQQEVVRSQRREMQILEAKRADAQKGLDLLKKRHEMGALSKLQYDNMSAKRQAELARIEAEIAAMEAEG